MALLKGSAWTINFQFIKERFGADALEKIFEKMSPEDQAALRKPIVDVVWGADFSVYMRFILLADQIYGKNDKALIRDTAKNQFMRDTKLYSWFFKVLNPNIVCKISPALWATYFKPCGKFEYHQLGEKHGEFYLTGFDNMPLFHDVHHTQYMTELLTHCGAKNASVVHTKCTAKGDASCTWDMHWE
ncbi:hypothetical protein JW933_01315 [candidate division FCPU426 bacterium]|nr:hypothetical protein [candidate division FCPU426 bacterium]